MPEPTKRILIVEDEYYLAEDCAQEIVRHGMQVVGPIGKVESALQTLAQDGPDCAIIDLNLQGELAFKVVQAVRDRGVPFIVYTGYSKLAFPVQVAGIVTVEKPTSAAEAVLKLLECMTSTSSYKGE
jgi:ActR/RegA family two-component response regulator